MFLVRFLVIAAVIFFISGSLSIAFIYESQTLWYKIGMDKTILRAGQLAGLLAAALLVLQVMLGSRGKILESVFSVASLVRLHRKNGILIAICVILHVLLILIPEGITNLPMGRKHWPEMIGVLLLWIVLSMVFTSHFRDRLNLDYKRWRSIHWILAYLTPVILISHVYFVSDSFQQTVPRVALLVTFSLLFIWILLHKFVTRLKQH